MSVVMSSHVKWLCTHEPLVQSTSGYIKIGRKVVGLIGRGTTSLVSDVAQSGAWRIAL